METYIRKAEDLESINNTFIPPLLDAILGDYTRNVPAARDAEVLNVMTTITSRLGVRAHSVAQSNPLTLSTAFANPPSRTYPRCRLRLHVEHDQSRLLRIS